ncbi:MAG TPA: hypothetical protein VFO76_04750 [Candidatus Kapabacteria bacterium]|nr:hypothetical protein [Candidatus Kapabacteria bacterium]
MAKIDKKYITIGFDASREPLDELFWCEATSEGDWTNITTCDRLRSRREIVERIGELNSAIVAVDFPLSFPKGFIEYLGEKKIATTHAELSKRIRADLKKNTDDGVRAWIEYIGSYRESNTEPFEGTVARFAHPGAKPEIRKRPEPPAHEKRTLIERFRRIDRILRRPFPDAVASTLGVQYNRLTRRYEFVSANARGRSALIGISLLEQVREAKPDVAIWPFESPKSVTIVEAFPKMFDRQFKNDDELKKFFDHEEDNALYVSREVREQVYAHSKAKETLFTLLGILAAEKRENKMMRPLRDYREAFYANDEVRLEGWAYGIGFKELQAKPVSAAKIEASEVPSEQTSEEAPVDPVSGATVETEVIAEASVTA